MVINVAGEPSRPVRSARRASRPRCRPSVASATVLSTSRRVHVYTVTTIRLTASQKRSLERARSVLRKSRRREVPRGEAVAVLAEFALRHRESLAAGGEGDERIPEDDPLFDFSIVFDIGRTDERTHDRVLYGRRRRSSAPSRSPGRSPSGS